MTEREKAEELVEKFLKSAPITWNDSINGKDRDYRAKQCALVACDEILRIIDCSYDGDYRQEYGNFYKEVKRIIEEEL